MPSDVVMPRLGWTMEVGRVVEWLKTDGDRVAVGDLIFSVESDKAVTEVEALNAGVLRIPTDSPAPGVEVPVGAMLAYILAPGESAPSAAPPGASPPDAAPATPAVPAPSAASPPLAAHPVTADRAAVSPRARRAAAALGLDPTTLLGSGATGRVVERDVRLAAAACTPGPAGGAADTTRPRATPVVRRLAEENGVDLGPLAASAPGGRVTRADVRAATDAPDPGAPLGHLRRVVGERMAASARAVAPVTLTTEADATELARLRDHLKTELASTGAPVPSYTDLLIRLAALALVEHPDLNASLLDDRLVRHAAVHIGVAVDTERGLVVPVVRDAHRRSVHDIAAETVRLIAAARAGTIAAADLRGGTFTITNLGMYDIDAFTPIVNLPECAVLGLGRLVARPVVVDEATETIAVRRMLALSLTFDHRLVDGAPAARFLQQLKRMVERPYAGLTR